MGFRQWDVHTAEHRQAYVSVMHKLNLKCPTRTEFTKGIVGQCFAGDIILVHSRIACVHTCANKWVRT